MRWGLATAAGLLIVLAALNVQSGQGQSGRGGFRALAGAAARAFAVPGDMRLVARIDLEPDGLTYERYQQNFGPAKVLGGQITVYRDGSGGNAAVIGAHYPDIVATNAAGLPTAAAARIVERDVGRADKRTVDLTIDPDSGRYLFLVESRSFASRWFHWIDAASGKLLNWDRTADLKRITVPTLTIGARYDTMDPKHMEWMAGELPNGRYLFCPNGSHMCMYDDQATYFDGLVGFLKDVDAGGYR